MPKVSKKKNTVYDNCKIYSMTGELLSRVNYKTIQFYLMRNLAHWVRDDNYLSIRLNFKHKSADFPNEEDPFYLQDKDNKCVVCGETDELGMHHCVPACFRKNFSKEFKDNWSHDVLPVCITCHNVYEREADKLKINLLDKFELNVSKPIQEFRVIAANASALVRHGHQMPQSRKDELLAIIGEYIQREAHQNDVDALAEKHVPNTIGHQYHYTWEEIVQRYGAKELIILWRKHFLDTMKPKFLPKHWDIYHKIDQVESPRPCEPQPSN